MTTKRSDFGTLADRLAAQTPLDESRVRHVWLDSLIPALVVDRRRSAAGWEGRLVWVSGGRLVCGWVAAERVSVA